MKELHRLVLINGIIEDQASKERSENMITSTVYLLRLYVIVTI